MPDDPMQVGVGRVQNLLDPVHQLHIRIAAQFAEYRRALDRLVGRLLSLPNNTERLIHSCGVYSFGDDRFRIEAQIVGGRVSPPAAEPARPAQSLTATERQLRHLVLFRSKRASQSSSKQRYVLTQATSFLSGAPPGRKPSY